MIYRDLFYTYFPGLLGELYFRFNLRLVPEKRLPIDVESVKKIYIFATSGIGNLIMLTPMIQTLRHGIPDAKIKIVVLPNGARYVLEGSDLVDEVIVLDSKRKLRDIRHDWPDLTIAATHRGYMRAKEAFRTGAFWRIGFKYDYRGKHNTSFLFTHAVEYDQNKHEVEQGLDLIRPLGLQEIRKLYMHVEQSDREFIHDMLDRYHVSDRPLIGIFTGLDPNKPKHRCISLDKFAKLGDILSDKYDANIVIVGSIEEAEPAKIISDMMRNKPLIFTGMTTLRQLAALMEHLIVFVGSDGGPMHIAAAMNIPVVGIFGPTDWISHAPYGERCRVVRSDLACAPCHKPHGPGVKCETLDCLRSITVEMILDSVSSLLD